MSWIDRLLGRTEPVAPQVPEEAYPRGSVPAQIEELGQQMRFPDSGALSPAISEGEVERFLYRGAVLSVVSSNVDHVEWDHRTSQLIVTYRNGSQYAYENISEGEARSFAEAPSKGTWVWNFLRIKGTKHGHKKPYRRLR